MLADHPSHAFPNLAFLADDPDLDHALIFGSVAGGTARPDSDIDVAVHSRSTLGPRALQDLTDRISLATGRPVDLVDLARADGALLRQILRTGKVLFSRNPALTGILTERLLDWQEDLEPALNTMLGARINRFTASIHGS